MKTKAIITQTFLIVTAFTILFSAIKTEGKATKFLTNLDAEGLGRVDSSDIDEEALQSYGRNRRIDAQVIPKTSQWGNDARQEATFARSELINFLLQEIRNGKLQDPRREVGRTSSVIFRPPTYGKRQIVYRQCFFNPISCF